MSTVLVTGGAGNLGRQVSWALTRRGHSVRALVHRSRDVVDGVDLVEGDVVTGAGITDAVDGVDAVVHTATAAGRSVVDTEVRGTRTVLDAAEHVGAHFVYVSKVGVDRHRLAYYDAKWEAEGVVEELGTRWSIQRVTEFHDLIEQLLSAPVFFKTPALAFQPIDVAEVAARLADLVESGPVGRATDLGGPELLGIETLAARRRRITGRRSRLVRVPCVGAIRDFSAGLHLCPEHRDGTVTWDAWLERSMQKV